MFWKTEKRAIDKLLGGRQGDPAQICLEFDPDLANAYIEHSLTTTETSRYEQHLSACTHCRKSVVALSRMAAAEQAFAHPAAKSLAIAGESRTGIKRWFGVMSAPQWGMAAAAVLVVAISLPILISSGSRNSSRPQTTSIQSEQADAKAELQADVNSPSTPASKDAAANTSAQPGQQPGGNAQAKNDKEQEGPNKDLLAVAKGPEAEQPSTVAGAAVEAPQQPQPVEPRADTAAADQAAARAAEQARSVAPSPPPPSRQEEPQLPKINPDEAKSLPQEKGSAQVAQLKPGLTGGEEMHKKEATIREQDNVAPPSSKNSSSESRARSKAAMTEGAPGSSKFRDSNSEAVRSASSSLKVGGRKFWLKDDIWIDKDYNPKKEMPMITVFRDSDVYRELLSKHSGMRPFLTGFTETARVIFIYKGTVYKLIPQDGSK